MPNIISDIERDLTQQNYTSTTEGIDERLDDDEISPEEAGFLQGYHENFDE